MKEVKEEQVNVCDVNATFKAYEDYHLINNTSSPAYNYIVNNMVVGDDGLLRNSNGSVGVALSALYGEVGTEYLLKFSSGQQLRVVIIDHKANVHLVNNCTDGSGGMIEFVVDTNLMDSEVKYAGSYNVIYEGSIVEMKVLHE